jgi:hypothetical protein
MSFARPIVRCSLAVCPALGPGSGVHCIPALRRRGPARRATGGGQTQGGDHRPVTLRHLRVRSRRLPSHQLHLGHQPEHAAQGAPDVHPGHHGGVHVRHRRHGLHGGARLLRRRVLGHAGGRGWLQYQQCQRRRGGSAERSASASARGNRFANVVTIRGFDVPFQTRLGFRVGGLVITPTTNIALGGLLDSVNMDRLEVVKGPNSLLYGVGVLSGIVNTIPKKPTSAPQLDASVSVGSYGFRRATLDASTRVFKRGDHSLNARVAGSWEEREHYTDWQTKKQQYQVGQLDYFYKDKANAFFEFQTSRSKLNGTGDQWIFDDGGGSEPFFRNEWDEAYNFARQSGPIAGVGEVSRRVITVDAQGRPLRNPRVELFYAEADPAKRRLVGGALPDTTRLTGPDTYEKRDEDNLLVQRRSHAHPESRPLRRGLLHEAGDRGVRAQRSQHQQRGGRRESAQHPHRDRRHRVHRQRRRFHHQSVLRATRPAERRRRQPLRQCQTDPLLVEQTSHVQRVLPVASAGHVCPRHRPAAHRRQQPPHPGGQPLHQ